MSTQNVTQTTGEQPLVSQISVAPIHQIKATNIKSSHKPFTELYRMLPPLR